MKKVSIIVRSYNDIEFIDQTMSSIMSQRYNDFELINVDCSSDDGTLEIIKKYNTDGKIYKISPKEYIPGVVLNNMVKNAEGEIIVFNNSDCIPQNQDWLGNLVSCFSDKEVITSFGNQLPRSDANPLVKKDNIRAFGDGAISAKWKHFFSLATSAARKDILLNHPFNEKIQYSEDIEWSYRMKKLGFKIVYCKDAEVEHSHNYTLKEVKKRFYSEGYAEGIIYGEKDNIFIGFIKPLIIEIARDLKFLISKGNIFDIPYGLVYRVIQKCSIYRGKSNYFKGKILWNHLQN